MNDYGEALEYLFSLEKSGIVFGLDNVEWLLSLLGHPEADLRAVHIGGTNGKGSVASMVVAILRQAGLRVGKYTSPHLISFTERITIDEAEISEEEVARLTDLLRRKAQRADPSRKFTFFDFTTALAFEHFRRGRVDIAVVEVGLGGRLDSTNVLWPLVTVITNVAFDHMEYLGNDLASIAREKAGIIKKGVPVVTAAAGVPLEVIRAESAGKSPLYVLGEAFGFEKVGPRRMSYRGIDVDLRKVTLSLYGDHQLGNAAIALATAELLRRGGTAVAPEAMAGSLAGVSWPGRLEVVREEPRVILDGAHNPDGARSLAAFLAEYCRGRRVILVLGVMKDKDFEGIVAILAPLADTVILTRPKIGRAAPPEMLSPLLPAAAVTRDVAEALAKARDEATKDDVIVITGSLYTVGEAKSILGDIF